MKTEWKNIEPFKRHLEEMASFRRAHAQIAPVQQAKTESGLPDHCAFTAPWFGVPENLVTDVNGRVIVVPIWDVEVPRDSQN